VSNRTYLSIGDVLTLLREEFPDVTISKIRFLESQGLVNPERSPSGYRKFFDHDVERLRWVLRQQREHFLPLKVIRDRLAEGELDDPSAPASIVNGNASVPNLSTVGPTADRQTTADDEAMARIIADASRRAARLPDAPAVQRAVHVVAGPSGPGGAQVMDRDSADAPSTGATPPATVTPGAAAVRSDAQVSRPTFFASASPAGGPVSQQPTPGEQSPPPTRAASAGSSGAGSGTPGTPTPPTSTPSGSTPPGSPTLPPHTPRSGTTGATSGQVPVGPTSSVVTGVSMTAAELCAASGLAPEDLADLQSYGLVESVSVAGIPTFDEEALAIANLAAGFRVFGIEARHLRQFRMAVDREMGLIEQVVIPLLRQRNPEARQRALEGAEQLALLGESMRAALLRVALHHQLRG
jgi:DNA-binding transcriptional MerR regulator